QVKFVDCGLLLFGRHGPFFVNACQSGKGNTNQADTNSQKNHPPRVCPQDLCHELTTKNRRHQRSKCSTEAQNNRHAEREPQITHRQSERQAANSPEQAKEESPEERDLGTLGENCSQIFGDEQTQEPGRNDPTEYAACEPKCFPRPMFHAAIRHIEAAGRETTEPVQKHSQGRIWSHFVTKCELQMKYFFQRNHHTIRQNALRLHEKPSHFALPAFIYFSFGH